jgi:hypothetical protein
LGDDAVPELEQFTLDSLVARALVLAGHPFDQRGDGVIDGWATGADLWNRCTAAPSKQATPVMTSTWTWTTTIGDRVERFKRSSSAGVELGSAGRSEQRVHASA